MRNNKKIGLRGRSAQPFLQLCFISRENRSAATYAVVAVVVTIMVVIAAAEEDDNEEDNDPAAVISVTKVESTHNK